MSRLIHPPGFLTKALFDGGILRTTTIRSTEIHPFAAKMGSHQIAEDVDVGLGFRDRGLRILRYGPRRSF